MTSIDSFIRFLETRGARVLFAILDDLNAGSSHSDIARKWHMTEASLSRHVHRYYRQEWRLSADTAAFLELYNRTVADRASRRSAQVLSLPGSADA